MSDTNTPQGPAPVIDLANSFAQALNAASTSPAANTVSQHPSLVDHTESIYAYLANELSRFSELVNIVSELKGQVDAVHNQLVGKVHQAESWFQKEEQAAKDWLVKEENAIKSWWNKK